VAAIGICVVGLVLAAAVLGGCGRKSTTVSARPGTGPAGVSGSSQATGQTTYVPGEEITWAYETMPVPEPAHKPRRFLKEFNFNQGSTSMDREALGVMYQVVAEIKDQPSVRLLIIGFADKVGEAGKAESLAMGRADSARKAFMHAGIPGDRIESASFGSTQAKADSYQKLAQELDRKVEVWVLEE